MDDIIRKRKSSVRSSEQSLRKVCTLTRGAAAADDDDDDDDAPAEDAPRSPPPSVAIPASGVVAVVVASAPEPRRSAPASDGACESASGSGTASAAVRIKDDIDLDDECNLPTRPPRSDRRRAACASDDVDDEGGGCDGLARPSMDARARARTFAIGSALPFDGEARPCVLGAAGGVASSPTSLRLEGHEEAASQRNLVRRAAHTLLWVCG